MTNSFAPISVDQKTDCVDFVAVGSRVETKTFTNQLKSELARNTIAIQDTWQVVAKEIGLRVAHGKPPATSFPADLKRTYAPTVWSAA